MDEIEGRPDPGYRRDDMEPPQHEIDPFPNDGLHLVLSTVPLARTAFDAVLDNCRMYDW